MSLNGGEIDGIIWWDGSAGTRYFIDPVENMVVVIMTQVRRQAETDSGKISSGWWTRQSFIAADSPIKS